MAYTYDYPRPMVTVDVFLWRKTEGSAEVLLIRRQNAPHQGKWALPGGYVDKDEGLREAAVRELAEETGISDLQLRQLGAYGDPGRDPRGHTITIVYGLALPANREMFIKAGDDAAETRWFSVEALPEMAFDHKKIISDCCKQIH